MDCPYYLAFTRRQDDERGPLFVRASGAKSGSQFGAESWTAEKIKESYPFLYMIMFCDQYEHNKPRECTKAGELAPEFVKFVQQTASYVKSVEFDDAQVQSFLNGECKQFFEKYFTVTIDASNRRSATVKLNEFANLFPVLDISSIKYAWGIDASGVGRAVQLTNGDVLRNTFTGVGPSLASVDVSGVRTRTGLEPTQFNINMDAYIVQRLTAAKKGAMKASQPSALLEEPFVDLMEMNKWHIDNNGDLVTVQNGKKVVWDESNEELIKQLKRSNKCYSSRFNESTCVTAMEKCVLSSNPDDLKDCIAAMGMTNDLVKDLKENISHLNPIVALRVLENFGFKQCERYDINAGMKLNKIQSVSEWKNGFLVQRFGAEKGRQILAGQTALEAYLHLLVQFVNANPGLLNQDYHGSAEEVVGTFAQTEFAQQAKLVPMGHPMRKSSDLGRLPGLIRQKQALDYSPHAYFLQSTRGFLPLLGDIDNRRVIYRGAQAGSMVGGGSPILNVDEATLRSGEILKSIFQSLLRDLESKNKRLGDADRQKIESWIDTVIASQRKVVRLTAFIQEYIACLEVNGNRKSEVVNFDKLSQYVDEHCNALQKLGERTAYVAKVLVECENACEDLSY